MPRKETTFWVAIVRLSSSLVFERFCKTAHLSPWMCQRRKFEWDEGFLTSRFKTRITTRLSSKVGQQQQGKKLLNQMRQFWESLQCEVDKACSDNNLVVGGRLKVAKKIYHSITIHCEFCFRILALSSHSVVRPLSSNVTSRVRKSKNFPDSKIFTAKSFRIKCVILNTADFATNAHKTQTNLGCSDSFEIVQTVSKFSGKVSIEMKVLAQV